MKNRTSMMTLCLILTGVPGGCGSEDETEGQTGSLEGTWDITFTGGHETSGVLTLSPSSGSVTYGGITALALMPGGTGTASWTDVDGTSQATFSHTSGGMNTGAIPLDLGGSWTFSSGGDACNATLTPNTFISSCNFEGGYLPKLDVDASSITAQRTAQASSMFGELGGTWNLVAGSGQCTVTLEGQSFIARCSRGDGELETLTVTVAGDTASGSSSFGWEFAAVRRQ